MISRVLTAFLFFIYCNASSDEVPSLFVTDDDKERVYYFLSGDPIWGDTPITKPEALQRLDNAGIPETSVSFVLASRTDESCPPPKRRRITEESSVNIRFDVRTSPSLCMPDKSFCATGSTFWTPYECLVDGTSAITEEAIQTKDVDLHAEIMHLRDALSNYHRIAHPDLLDHYKEVRIDHLDFRDPKTRREIYIQFNDPDDYVTIRFSGDRGCERIIIDSTGFRDSTGFPLHTDDTMKKVLYLFKHLHDAEGVQVMYKHFLPDDVPRVHRDRVFLTWKIPSYTISTPSCRITNRQAGEDAWARNKEIHWSQWRTHLH